ncbi:hypothetical protein ACQP2F_30855 [Actinoplanes sp. CA-030573]|uniref:hypothetical protein n=1 Tax=Actinoplanes sp. CA-030573 TaxID=3239898 RepID=UPI003D91E943
MAEHAGQPDDGSPAARLAALATRLREAAVQAGRLDVAEKADDALALLGEPCAPAAQGDRKRERRDTGNAIIRTLDGLGF